MQIYTLGLLRSYIHSINAYFYHNSVENFVIKCKLECNVRYIEHKTRYTKIYFKNLLLQIVLIYQQAIIGSRPKTK